MTTRTDAQWFELLDPQRFVAEYVDDDVSEVYSMRAGAPLFLRVRQADENEYEIRQLSNDRAELIHGEARVSNLSQDTLTAVIAAMLHESC